MSSVAVNSGMARSAALFNSVVGRKIVMAVTGVILTCFVLGHMVGNLQIFLGPERINAYGRFLHANMELLWPVRIVLLLSVSLHVLVWSGPIVAAFIVYHLLHFTTGTAHPNFIEGDVYHNVITGFQVPAAALFYIVANILLAMHLYHGAWSMFQTLGVNHPRYTPWLKGGAKVFGVVIGLGNCSIPLAVLAGLLSQRV